MSNQSRYVRCPSCGCAFDSETCTPPPADPVQEAHSYAPTTVLHSWKDIAAYVGRGVRTVQRWEHDLGMPVHRVGQRDRRAVIGFPEEIDGWLRHMPVGSQSKKGNQTTAPPAPRDERVS
jgi:hypothetical protein